MDMTGMTGMMGIMVVGGLLVVALILGTIGLLAWGVTRQSRTRSSDALRILDERFARGELDQPDYGARRAAIQGNQSRH